MSSFRRKPYPEVAESLLNRLLGGVSAEAHPYPPAGAAREPYAHALERAPVERVTAVWGARNGTSVRFQPDADWRLATDKRRLEWIAGGQRPDEGTAFEVHYLPVEREVGVNDLYPGSVVRTLMEAVALESASLYAQMEVVYKSGFIDTAEGRALDHVVSLLGLSRVLAGRNTAELRFTRVAGTRGAITLPAGTRVATADGAIEYETLADLTLADGQPSAKGLARDLVASNEAVAADTLVLLTRPVAGIESVSNPGASSRLDRDENDTELRTRARRFLVGAERGTRSALEAAIAAEGVRAEVTEPEPGRVRVLLHAGALEPTQRARLEAAAQRVRPAGVWLEFVDGNAPVSVDLELRLSTAAGRPETELRAIQQQVHEGLAAYFSGLPLGSDASLGKLLGLTMGVAGVEDARLVSASVAGVDKLDAVAGRIALAGLSTQLGTLKLHDPALATGLTLVVRYIRTQALPDQAALQAALEAAVAALNTLAAADNPANDAQRVLSWGGLTRLLPLPGFNASTFNSGAAPATDAEIGAYRVQWVFTRADGGSTLLQAAADAPFALGTPERLSVQRVAVEVQASS